MGCTAPFQLGRLRRPSTTRETGSLGHSSRATGASQKSAGYEGCVHQVCRLRSEVQKGRTLPLRVWPHVDVGCTEGALGPGCRSRTPLGVPRTEPSAPLMCRCCSRALHRGVADRAFKIEGQGPKRVQEFLWLSLPGSSTSAADVPLLRGFRAREQPSQ